MLMRLSFICVSIALVVAATLGITRALTKADPPTADPIAAVRLPAPHARTAANSAADSSLDSGTTPSSAIPIARRQVQPESDGPPSMIRALIDALDGESDIPDEQKHEARRSLEVAEEQWQAIKAQNKHTIRQMNRQVRANLLHAPNILLISVADMGIGDIGPYGQSKAQTPELDRMAGEGTWYTDYYAGSSQAVPGVCSLMTGLHTGHCRLRGNEPRLPLTPADVTLPEVLWQAGYRTELIGRWILGDPGSTGAPTEKGFDDAWGIFSHPTGRDQYPARIWHNGVEVALNQPQRDGLLQDLFTEQVLTRLEQGSRRPSFLYLSMTNPQGDVERIEIDPRYESEPWSPEEKRLASAWTRLDNNIGRILQRIREQDPARATYVLVTSENGPSRNESAKFLGSTGYFRGGQGSLLEGGIRVPMIVWSSDDTEISAETSTPWAAWDLLPTIADLVFADRVPGNLDGTSRAHWYWPQPEEEEDEDEDDLEEEPARTARFDPPLYWELYEGGFSQAVRIGHWKALRPALGVPVQLFNLREDLQEENNLAADHAAVVREAETVMEASHVDSREWPRVE